VASSVDGYFWKKGGTGQGNGNGTTQTPEQIRDALASLAGNNRLSATAIKNLPSNGDPGADGQDGRNPEFQFSSTHLQYRLIGDTQWIDLVAKSEITGPAGATGPQGATGSTGAKGDKGDTGATGSVSAASGVTLDQIATPSDPGSGKTIIYSKSDGKVYKFSGGGTEEAIGTGSSSGGSGGGREVLTSDRTYFVRTNGSDSNNGLSDTVSGAFLTFQKAFDTIAQLDDKGIYKTTISFSQIFNLTESLTIKRPIGGGKVILDGNSTGVIQSASSNTIGLGMLVNTDRNITFKGFTVNHSSMGIWSVPIVCKDGGILFLDGLNFGNLPNAPAFAGHLLAETNGIINIISNYSISGGAGESGSIARHYHSRNDGIISIADNLIITLTNNPKFNIFALCEGGKITSWNTFYNGGVSGGQKYFVSGNGVINTFGGATVFPGSDSGATSAGGQYL
jgi:hypothetical protein